jgi:hypothetical protein
MPCCPMFSHFGLCESRFGMQAEMPEEMQPQLDEFGDAPFRCCLLMLIVSDSIR